MRVPQGRTDISPALQRWVSDETDPSPFRGDTKGNMANTKKLEKEERKKMKRASRKKAAPKAKRTHARGEKKKKVKKLVRGQSKR
jgi:hypothetical protein